jgi:uncharacterized protein (TIGR00730 family)
VSPLGAVCVFCGSAHGTRAEYTASARELGAVLASRQVELVYGGGDIGLMGELADAVLDAGGRATGVIPRFMVEHEIAHQAVTELHIVSSMHERKTLMASLSDAFIALPGGWGTLEELMEIVTWAQLGLHHKPIGLLDVGGYYSRLTAFLDHATTEGFIRPDNRELLLADDAIDSLLDRLTKAVDDP